MANNKIVGKETDSLVSKASLSSENSFIQAFSSESIDDYGDFTLTVKAQDRLAKLLFNTKVGISTVTPMICRGEEECPFISRCPIRIADGKEGIYPTNKQCPIEVSFVKNRFLDYLQECDIEYEHAESSPTIRSLVDRLVSLDLYELRLSYILAGTFDPKDSTLLKDQVSIQDGFEVNQTMEHPALLIKDKFHKQRMDILEALIATPRGKMRRDVALKRRDSEDYVSKTMKVLESLEEIISKK